MLFRSDILQALSRFRCLADNLKIQKIRYGNRHVDVTELYCEKCDMCAFDDEFHFILVCPYFNDSRQNLLPEYYYKYPTQQKFIQLLSCKNENIIRSLALYIKRNLNR